LRKQRVGSSPFG